MNRLLAYLQRNGVLILIGLGLFVVFFVMPALGAGSGGGECQTCGDWSR